VVIKGEHSVGIHDSWDAARDAGLRLCLLEPHLVHQVRANEPAAPPLPPHVTASRRLRAKRQISCRD